MATGLKVAGDVIHHVSLCLAGSGLFVFLFAVNTHHVGLQEPAACLNKLLFHLRFKRGGLCCLFPEYGLEGSPPRAGWLGAPLGLVGKCVTGELGWSQMG